MKKCFILFFFSFIFCSHSIKQDIDVNNKEQLSSLIYIKIEKPNIASLPCLRLSEFADSVEYVQLETTQECLLPYYIGGRTFVTGNLLFIFDLFAIYQFDIQTGKFLRRIGRVGQGPGEYIQVNAAVDTIVRKVFVKSPGKTGLMMYDYEGKYLGNLPLGDKQDPLFSTCFYSFKLIGTNNDDSFIFHSELMPVKQACHPYELIVYNYKNKKIQYSLPNRLNGEFRRDKYSVNGLKTLIKSGDTFFYKSFYNDTLYATNKTGINPYAVIDLGRRKYPTSAVFSRNPGLDIVGKILINSIYIRYENIFLECIFIKDERFKENDSFICKYNAKTGNMTYYKTPILNDIDGGCNISISYLDSTLSIIPTIPLDVVKEEQRKIFFSSLDKSELKYPELKDKFDNMQANRNPDDNPLLMILHKKK